MPKPVVTGVNDLATLYPNVAYEWDFSKNTLTPDKIASKSNKKMFWVCLSGHSWSAIVSNRTKGSGCPECANKSRGENISKTKAMQNKSLSEISEDLLEDWCILNSFNPYVRGQSLQTLVLWICRKCSHSWSAVIYKRIKGNGCPNCWTINRGEVYTKSIVSLRGSFAENHPDLLKDWDFEKNSKISLDPSLIPSGSSDRAHWLCATCDYSWRASPKVRVKGQSCMRCSRGISIGENDLAIFIESMGFETVRNSRSIIAPYEIDIFIPTLNIAIEYNGNYWHSDERSLLSHGVSSEERHSQKFNLCVFKDIILGFVWESDWVRNRIEVEQALIYLLNSGEISPILSKLSNNDRL